MESRTLEAGIRAYALRLRHPEDSSRNDENVRRTTSRVDGRKQKDDSHLVLSKFDIVCSEESRYAGNIVFSTAQFFS